MRTAQVVLTWKRMPLLSSPGGTCSPLSLENSPWEAPHTELLGHCRDGACVLEGEQRPAPHHLSVWWVRGDKTQANQALGRAAVLPQ